MARYAIVDTTPGIVLYTAIHAFSPGGNWIPSDTANIGDSWDGVNFTAPTPTAAAYGAALKRVVHSIMRQKKNGGVTVNGKRWATDADGKSELALDKQHPPAGSRKKLGKSASVTENNGQMNARTASIHGYLVAVEEYAVDLNTSIDAEILANDLPALQVIAGSLAAGWPSDLIS